MTVTIVSTVLARRDSKTAFLDAFETYIQMRVKMECAHVSVKGMTSFVATKVFL